MTRTEALIRSVLGPTPRKILPLVHTIDMAIELSFAQNRSIEDLMVTKEVYPAVAKRLQLKTKTVSRQVDRITKLCWYEGDRARLQEITGTVFPECPKPWIMVMYFAAYSYYGIPYRDALEKELSTAP